MSNSTSSLALSSLHVHLEDLEKKHKWLLKQIKRKRTELNNFVEQMRSLATEIFQRGTPSFKKHADLDREIHSLFDEIFNKRKFGKQTKKDIAAIYRNLQLIGLISLKTDNAEEDTQIDDMDETYKQDNNFSDADKEHHHQHQEAQYQVGFASAHRSDASRKVRQIFLRLAEIFHPDKVVDTPTQAHHTEIMKEINKAYQEGDLARLLEIERQHQVGQSIESNSDNDLSRKCTHLEQENEFLTTQYENLKRDLAEVKHTPEGVMVSNCRKATKQGTDPIAQMLEQVESEIQMIADIRDFVRDFRDQKVTIKEFLDGPPTIRNRKQEMMEDLFEQMLEDLGGIIIF